MKTAEVRPLALDFVGRRRAWSGWVLLGVAVLFALDAGAWFVNVTGEMHTTRAQLERTAKATAAARKASPEEVAAGRDAAQRLSLPWLDLLAALESAATEEVALLGIDPDAAKGTVLITGEARDYLATLDYLRGLGRSETLSQVQLVRHEQKGRAVAFSVSADWLDRRVRVQQ
jgi:hypothetical protein